MPSKEYAYKIFDLLKKHYPHAKMILEWTNHFELLVAIILSAQCTDKKVNEVTKIIFPKYKKRRQEFEELYNRYTSFILSETKDPLNNKKTQQTEKERKEFAEKYQKYQKIVTLPHPELVQLVNFAYVALKELELDVKSTGFYHNKAKSVQNAAKTVLDTFHGVLPKTIEAMTTIPGVGRKTANVFLGNAYHVYEGIAVDTHVTKQSQRLGLTKQTTPEKIEQDLMKLFDKKDWFALTYLLIEHGRNMRRKITDRIVCDDPACILCNQR